MAITAKELAGILGLSEAAVSMALNHKPGVSTATRKRVVEEAKARGYDFTKIRELAAENRANGIINFIIYRRHGAVVTDTPFFSQLSEGIDRGCKSRHYLLNIYYLYEKAEKSVEAQLQELLLLNCRGIILLGTEMREIDYAPFTKLSLPVVLLDNSFDKKITDCVLINNVQGAYQATDYLIRKCKAQPGYLHSSYPIHNFEERADGFYKAVRENGMSASKSVVHRLSPSMEGARADMLELLEAGEETARCYFADNDLIAYGAIKAFQEKGFRIPQDVAVIGFDDMPMCTYMEPPLTTVNVPKQYMGEMAVCRLHELLTAEQTFPVKLEIATNLVKRKSV